MLLSSRSTASVRASGRAAPAPRRVVRVLAHGHGHGGGHGHGHGSSGTAVLTEKDKGFIAEMRKVAMKLHTKDQAPKEGEKEAPKQGPWTPTRPGYLRFLVESKEVFDTFERLVNSSDAYKALRNTGLERGPGLAADIAWMEQSFQLAPPDMKPDGAAATYVAFLEKLAKTDPPAFICHYYNFYFAHTAGGRMIGNKGVQHAAGRPDPGVLQVAGRRKRAPGGRAQVHQRDGRGLDPGGEGALPGGDRVQLQVQRPDPARYHRGIKQEAVAAASQDALGGSSCMDVRVGKKERKSPAVGDRRAGWRAYD
eukprot:XP_001702583.1 heme oxygenase [Chlamydomonas reinhardtii]